MKQVVVLRHAEKHGEGLSADGAEACRDLARRIGRFGIVISSESERCMETASLLAGTAATEDARANTPVFPAEASHRLRAAQEEHPLGIIGGIWEESELIECARKAGRKLLELVEESLQTLGDNERALIISHDGTIVAFEKLLLTDEPFNEVNHSFGPLQGIVVDEDLHCRPFVDPGTIHAGTP